MLKKSLAAVLLVGAVAVVPTSAQASHNCATVKEARRVVVDPDAVQHTKAQVAHRLETNGVRRHYGSYWSALTEKTNFDHRRYANCSGRYLIEITFKRTEDYYGTTPWVADEVAVWDRKQHKQVYQASNQ